MLVTGHISSSGCAQNPKTSETRQLIYSRVLVASLQRSPANQLGIVEHGRIRVRESLKLTWREADAQRRGTTAQHIRPSLRALFIPIWFSSEDLYRT
jgi:hypothetical protein